MTRPLRGVGVPTRLVDRRHVRPAGVPDPGVRRGAPSRSAAQRCRGCWTVAAQRRCAGDRLHGRISTGLVQDRQPELLTPADCHFWIGAGMGSCRPRRIEWLVGTPAPLGARVLLVNDVTTTGTAIHALARMAREAGGAVAGAAWFASRHLESEPSLPYPTVHVADVDLPSWPPQNCQLCAAGDYPEKAQDLN